MKKPKKKSKEVVVTVELDEVKEMVAEHLKLMRDLLGIMCTEADNCADGCDPLRVRVEAFIAQAEKAFK